MNENKLLFVISHLSSRIIKIRAEALTTSSLTVGRDAIYYVRTVDTIPNSQLLILPLRRL